MNTCKKIINIYIELFRKINSKGTHFRRMLAKINMKYFLFFVMFLPALFIGKTLDNDFYFLYKHGEYVITNGFPTTEPFSIHNNLNFVMQQWLSSTIFYLIRKYIGVLGVILFITFISILNIYLLYRILVLITDNITWSCFLTIPNSIFINDIITTRPLVISYTLTLILIYVIILYTQNNNKKLLYFLPFISILQSNLHASMWLFLFFMIMPFIFELKVFAHKNICYETYDKKPLLLFTFLMIPAGLINPYGSKALLYVLKGLSSNSYIINEMQKPTLSNSGGHVLLFILILFTLLFIYSTKKINIRYIFLFWGSYLLYLYALRNILYIALACTLLAGHIVNEVHIEKIINKIGLIKIYILALILFILGCCTFIYLNSPTNLKTAYDAIDYVADNCKVTEDTKVYTGYNNGAYAIYRNLKCYIDPRMEVYLKSQNGVEDIFDEYISLQEQELDYEEFLKRYDFDYIIVSKNDILYKKLPNHTEYKCIYENEKSRVYIPIR